MEKIEGFNNLVQPILPVERMEKMDERKRKFEESILKDKKRQNQDDVEKGEEKETGKIIDIRI